MNSRLTVADCRTQLWTLADASDINSAKFLRMLNEVCEKYILSGKWKGAVVNVDFDSAEGYISLPYEYYSVLCMTYNKCPAMTFSQFHTYQENGPGELDETKAWPGILIDLGDGFATQSDITTAGTLKVMTNVVDDAKKIRIFGLDASNNVIYGSDGVEGELVTCTAPFVNTTHTFSKVTGIQATPDPAITMQSGWTLWVNGAPAVQIGSYYPGENRPMYRRYQTGKAEKAIRVCCHRRFMLMRNESDWVIPGNLSALRSGFWALNFIDGSDQASANAAFEDGLKWLNNEAKASRGGSAITTNFMNWGMTYGYGNGSWGTLTSL